MSKIQQINVELVLKTRRGKLFKGDSLDLMGSGLIPNKSIDLVVTSPPFGLIRQKEYGNKREDAYLEWFHKFALGFKRILKPKGSLIIDIGGSWQKGLPIRSLYHFELLLMLVKELGFYLAQEFYWWNPSKLPSPAEWVTIRRIRVKDAINCIWWLSPTPFPIASNKRILGPYSESMLYLLKYGYKAKIRPSGHKISEKFQRDNSGAIPPNLLAVANTESNGSYQRYCREKGYKEHPARFPIEIPSFFISMLTNPGDTVFDPFAGSAITGEACEKMDRRWICCEKNKEYVMGSVGRFISRNNLQGTNRKARKTTVYKIASPSYSLGANSDILPKDGGKRRPRKRRYI